MSIGTNSEKSIKATEVMAQIKSYEEESKRLGSFHLVAPYLYLQKAEAFKYAYTSGEASLNKITLGDLIYRERQSGMFTGTDFINTMEGILDFRNAIGHDVIYSSDKDAITQDAVDMMPELDKALAFYFDAYKLNPDGTTKSFNRQRDLTEPRSLEESKSLIPKLQFNWWEEKLNGSLKVLWLHK